MAPAELTSVRGRPFLYPRGSIVGDSIRSGHVWDGALEVLVRELLRGRDCRICEVGSNIGASLPQIVAGAPAADVLAFEPSLLYRSFLRCNIALQDLSARVEVRGEAVADTAGEAILSIDGTSGTLLPAPGYRAEPVRLTTLDEVCGGEPLDYLKIDADGSDLRVLRGATRLLRAARPAIQLEICPPLLPDAEAGLHWLQEIGYRWFLCLDPAGSLAGWSEQPAEVVALGIRHHHVDVISAPEHGRAAARLAGLVRGSLLAAPRTA